MRENLVAPCGMNCEVCVAFKGYTMSGGTRLKRCIGCRVSGKKCAFLKKHCTYLGEKRVDYCYECPKYPCKNLKKLDDRYQRRYQMSLIGNLDYIREKGINSFLDRQESKYKCLTCGGYICCHTMKCYECNKNHPTQSLSE